MRSLILAALVCTTGLAWAEEPSAPVVADAAAPQVAGSLGATDDAITAKIRQELDKPTTLDFVETPLNEVIAYFADLHKIPIQLDSRHLEEAGVAADTPVNLHLSGVKLRNALDLMLENLDLAWIVKNQVLVITTRDAASEHLVTRVYPVADMVTISKCREDHESLISIVVNTIAPDSWGDAGGQGAVEYFRGVLVVTQTETIHDKLDNLLKQLLAPAAVTAREKAPPPREQIPQGARGAQEKAEAKVSASNSRSGGGFF
ncbi:MAG: hypothetical protein K1X71_17745 [Pirellulales bacterium]|nr:hypothetical protein [Pirellulales bacterium]